LLPLVPRNFNTTKFRRVLPAANTGTGAGRRREGDCKTGTKTEEADKRKMAKKTEGKPYEYEGN